MEKQPTEILEHIFNQLPNLRSLSFCFKTCVKWKQIIEEIYKNKAKILVSSGSQSASTIKFIEIIDLINPKFVFNMESKDNTDRIGSFGCVLRSQSLKDYFHDQAIICGRGARGTKGGLVMGNLKNTLKLFEPRYYASGVVLRNTTLWITGGRNGYGDLKSTEFVRIDRPTIRGPVLPFTISKHSMVQVNEKTIYILGGDQNGHKSQKTWVIHGDPITRKFKTKPGPLLKIERRQLSCAKMKIDGKVIIIVAGGIDLDDENLNNGKFNSICVELLDTSMPDQGWTLGPELPENMAYEFKMITSPTEKGVVFVGYNCIMELSGNSLDSLEWTKLDATLKNPSHVAFPITQNAFINLMQKVPKMEKRLKIAKENPWRDELYSQNCIVSSSHPHVDRAFICDNCGQWFLAKKQLKKHIDEKHNQKPDEQNASTNNQSNKITFSCTLSGDIMMKTDKKGMYKCNKCDRTFPKIQLLQTHILQVHELETYTCLICPNFHYTDQIILENHMIDNHSSDASLDLIDCIGCQKSYSPKKLLKHLSLDDFKFLYKQNCRKYYSDEKIDKIRLQIPILETHSCQICVKNYYNAQNLIVHFTISHNMETFVCDCGQMFKFIEFYEKHQCEFQNQKNYHKSSQEKPIQYCEKCDYSSSKISDLQIHYKEIHFKTEKVISTVDFQVDNNQFEVTEKPQTFNADDTFICDSCGNITINNEKHQCAYLQIEENEKPKDNMTNLNGMTAKTSDLNNETQKGKCDSNDAKTFICDSCGDTSMCKQNYEKHKCNTNLQIKENEYSKNDMISLNGSEKTVQQNNETHIPFVNFFKAPVPVLISQKTPQDNFKIKCTYCKFKFRAEDLEEHQTEFHPRGFADSSEVHGIGEGGGQSFQLEWGLCQRSFKRKDTLERHLSTVHSKSNMTEHIHAVHEGNKDKLHVDSKFAHEGENIQIVHEEHKKKDIPKRKRMADEAESNKSDGENIKPKQSKKFQFEKNSKHADETVTNKQYYLCQLCPKKFDMKIYLGGHMEYTHNIKESLFKNNKKGRKKNTYTYSKMYNKNVKN